MKPYIFIFLSISLPVFSQSRFEKIFKSGYADFGHCVKETSDRGYIVTGNRAITSTAPSDIFLMKTDSNGIINWFKSYALSGSDEARYVQQTNDSGYIICGFVQSGKMFLLKTDALGNLQWSKSYGVNFAMALYVKQTISGGYFVAVVMSIADQTMIFLL